MAPLYCDNGDLNLYKFIPSIAAASIFAILFAVLTLAHLVRMIRSKQWYLTALVVGGGCKSFLSAVLHRAAVQSPDHHTVEVGGFVIRILGHNDPCKRSTYILQTVLILVAPAIFSATIYMILGRTIRAVQGDALSPIRSSWLTKIFVTGDIVCFLVQGVGGAILASADNDKSKANLGRNVILVGLALQIILFGLFVVVACIFHSRIRKRPTVRSTQPQIQWRKMLLVLYGVSLLIMGRNLFRVIEYGLGPNGYLLTHEWSLYVFDATLMTLVMAALFWWHPTMIRPKEGYEMEDLEARPVANGGAGDQAYRDLSAQSPSPASSQQMHWQKQGR